MVELFGVFTLEFSDTFFLMLPKVKESGRRRLSP